MEDNDIVYDFKEGKVQGIDSSNEIDCSFTPFMDLKVISPVLMLRKLTMSSKTLMKRT